MTPCRLDNVECNGCGECASMDGPDLDPADHADYGFAEFPHGYHTKGPDGKSPADRMREILDRGRKPELNEDEVAF